MDTTLCTPSSPTDTVIVLVPGASYNQVYWDFPYLPDVYNFRRAMNAAGYATVTVDRLGSGKSTHPPSSVVSSSLNAAAVHQVIGDLRAGDLGGRPYRRVVIGGHSMGSAVTVLEAATYHDVDAVLVTGFSHSFNPSGSLTLGLSTVPGALDPQLRGDYWWDPGYLTTRAGTREAAFYAPSTADPQVVRVDEATKGVFTVGESGDAAAALALPITRAIDVPVLMALGRFDTTACPGGDCGTAADLAARERSSFTAPLSTYVLAGSGHDVNLEPDTGDYQSAVLSWLASSLP
jgi:pimeloyl-ACP methyl ester carboxylesterase